MQVCDFSRSFCTFRIDAEKIAPVTVSHKVPFVVNNARVSLECRCLVTEEDGSTCTEYVLAPVCITEQVYVEKDCWHQPSATMCIVFSDKGDFLIIKSWDRTDKKIKLYPPELGYQPERQAGKAAEAFDSYRISLSGTEGTVLEDNDAIVEAGLADRPMVSQTEFKREDGRRVLLEYPVKALNISERHHAYQVDTGPVLWPDAAAGAATFIETLRKAFIAHNSPDWAEFIVNVPTPLTEDISVNHYSKTVRLEGLKNRMIELA
jgi:hypothetical protein